MTIEGTGADCQGAIRLEPTAGAANPMNDSTFGTIALAGDATVTSTQRWGFSVAFRFNTHTLTRNGAGSMMLIGKFYGPGNDGFWGIVRLFGLIDCRMVERFGCGVQMEKTGASLTHMRQWCIMPT